MPSIPSAAKKNSNVRTKAGKSTPFAGSMRQQAKLGGKYGMLTSKSRPFQHSLSIAESSSNRAEVEAWTNN
jgi:hypothetical protein